MTDKPNTMRWTTWLYLALVALRCLWVVWRTDRLRCRALMRNLRLELANGARGEFFKTLCEQLLIPNYRLKPNIKLGRPSLTVYRKFFDLIQSVESHNAHAWQERKKPRYLLIRDGAMGDVLMLTPVVRALHRAHAGDIVIEVATHAGHVFDHNPYVQHVISPKQLVRGVHTYDVVMDLNGVYERMPNTHPVNAYAKVVLGVADFDKKLELYPTPADVALIDEVVHNIGGPFVVVHQFVHDWPNRTIEPAVWAQAVDAITASGSTKVVYVGTAQDLAPVRDAKHEDHRARYSLQQLSVLISKSQGFIGGDSGPSHVAATTDVPIVVFYTCAHHEARMPLREGGLFLPIFPALDCYGCLTRRSVPRLGYFCEREDNACVALAAHPKLKESIQNFLSKRPE
jgi:ADP-heptose:LPS heptosyltransferase